MARLRKRILMATWRNPSSVIHLFFSFSFKRTMRRRVKTVNDGFVRARLWKGWPQRSLDRALRPCGQTCLALTFTTQEINSKKRPFKRLIRGSWKFVSWDREAYAGIFFPFLFFWREKKGKEPLQRMPAYVSCSYGHFLFLLSFPQEREEMKCAVNMREESA